MRLRELFESKTSEVAIIFGRFNPPHKGHKAAWELASKSPVWYVGTNESTVGPKDPLPFHIKVEAMKAIWPEVESHIVAETSWLTLASKVYKEYPNATLLCLTDEDWVTKTIVQYNGKEGAHGFYNFKNIEQKPTPRLSSATALRSAVQAGDREAFSQAAGVSADAQVAGKAFFDLVAEYLMPYQNAPKKVAKKKKDPVNEFAPGGSEGNGPFDYGSAIISIGESFIDQYDDEGAGEDAAAIIKVGKTFISNGMAAGIKAFYMLDTQVRDHVAEELEDQGFNVKKDIYEPFKKSQPKSAPRPETEADRDWYLLQSLVKEFISTRKDSDDQETLSKLAKDFQWSLQLGFKMLPKSAVAADFINFAKNKGVDLNDISKKYVSNESVGEDAAGVGIITKQNTTKDVKKGTLRKMMKAFKLA